MFRIFVTPFIASALLFSACRTTAPAEGQGKKMEAPGGSYTNVSVAELQAMLGNKDFIFVNVHVPYNGDIPETDLSIPYDEIDQNLTQLPADKNAKIMLYCRSDRMSTIAAETLVDLGYTNVYNLDGGIVAWEQAGLKLDFR